MARIPPKTVSSDDKKNLENLETDLKRVVFGQDLAIEKLAAAIKLYELGRLSSGAAASYAGVPRWCSSRSLPTMGWRRFA